MTRVCESRDRVRELWRLTKAGYGRRTTCIAQPSLPL